MGKYSSVWRPCHKVQHFVESIDVRLQSFAFLSFHISQVCQWDNSIPSCLELLEERGAQLLPARDHSSGDSSEPLICTSCQGDDKNPTFSQLGDQMKLHEIVEVVEVILRSDSLLYTFMVGSLNLFGNLASRISRLKGDPVVTAINSASFSFMATIAQRRSSIRISHRLLRKTSECPLCAVDYRDCSQSRLLFSVSLRSTSWPNLLKTLPELLLSPFWLRRALSLRPLAPVEASVWERATSALGLAPVCWVLTAIGFSPIHYVRLAIGFLHLHRLLGAFRFSPVHCEWGVCFPLITLFLLALVKVEP